MHESTYLVHHGILGQKWYRRRFQNEDGSLTSEGRERYNVGKKIGDGYKKATNGIEKGYNAATNEIKRGYSGIKRVAKDGSSAIKTVTTDTKNALKTTKYAITPNKKNSIKTVDKEVRNRRKMSDQDLQKRIDRLKKEQELKRLNDENNHEVRTMLTSSGKKIAAAALVGVGAYGVNFAIRYYGPKVISNIAKNSNDPKVWEALAEINPGELAKWVAPNPNSKKK